MPRSSEVEALQLHDGLNLITVDHLKLMLQLLPSDPTQPTKKAELVAAVKRQLQGATLKTLWQELEDLAQAAIAEAIYNTQGKYQPELFKAKYGKLPNWGESHSARYSSRKISQFNLFFFATQLYGNGPYVLPINLQNEMKAYVPKPKTLTLPHSNEPPNSIQVSSYDFSGLRFKKRYQTQSIEPTVLQTERLAQQDLLAVLRLVHLGKIAVSDKTLMPSKAAMHVIASVLQPSDYYTEDDIPNDGRVADPIGHIKPFAWPMLLQGGGLASLNGKKLQLTPAGKKALNAPTSKTIKAVWKKWIKTKVIDELRRIDNIKGQTGKGKRGLTALEGRRKTISNVLRECTQGLWVNLEDLIRYMVASQQVFVVSRYPENLYFCEAGYGSFYDVRSEFWSFLQSGYLRCLLFEYAATLGLIDVAYIIPHNAPNTGWEDFWGADDLSFLSRYDGLLAIQLNPLGAFCLEVTDTYEAPEISTESSLRVLPNLEIVLTGAPLNASEALMMETFTRPSSEAVWKLDRAIALKTAAQGHTLQDFHDFLTAASTDPLPETVVQFFSDCLARTQSLQDQGLARLFECKDKALAALIAHDSRTKKYCHLAGDRHLVVPVAEETKFRNGLQNLGDTLPLSSS